MKTIFALPLLGLALIGSAAPAAPDISKLPPAATQTGVTYAKDIQPLFEASCFRCHGERQQKGDLRLDSLEAALKGGEDGKVITPGDSAKSSLVIAVAQLDNKTAMPPKRGGGPGGKGFGGKGPGGEKKSSPDGKSFGGKGPGGGPQSKPLTTEQVALVRAWIDQGAK
jgi:mono/diheme cytochrome c family protein